MKPARLDRLPDTFRQELKAARLKPAELDRRIGLPQARISAIETGKVVPQCDTLLDLVRVLDRDLVLVPRALVPAVQAMVRDHRRATAGDEEDRALYADDTADGRDEDDDG